jgi:hypothetical protein
MLICVIRSFRKNQWLCKKARNRPALQRIELGLPYCLI